MIKNNFWKILSVLLFILLGASVFFDFFGVENNSGEQLLGDVSEREVGANVNEVSLAKVVLPDGGVKLPVVWGDLGRQLVEAGVIDKQKFESLYSRRGGMTEEMRRLLEDKKNGQIVINQDNSGFWLNLLWAFGLANKNQLLDEGEMVNPNYGGAGNFASTGGWTVADGGAMKYYSNYKLAPLTTKQQALVADVSSNIYRPCCNNPTSFPDCNHGMAMLGLLELMAAQGADKETMYQIALAVNSYWFPDTYLTIAKYMSNRGIEWSDVSAKEVLGADYSSAGGFRQLLASIEPVKNNNGGGGCGV